jgi:hypothetical protein
MDVICQIRVPADLPAREEISIYLDWRLGGPKSWSVRDDEKKIPLHSWESNPSTLACNSVTLLATAFVCILKC